MKRLAIILILSLFIFNMLEIKGYDNMKQNSVYNTVARDDLGRSVTNITAFKEERYVGLFYFLWLGQQNQKEIYDITDILRRDTLANLTDLSSADYKKDATYFFNEPLYGYYNSKDPWVIRKHIELFITAGIDFLALDVTNGIYYDSVLLVLLDILNEYKEEGFNVPQIVFFTNLRSQDAVYHFYSAFYKKDKYKDLWFYGPYDKPLIIAKSQELTDDMNDFFYARPPQWPLEEKMDDGFPYMNISKPQDLYTNLINVSVSQFAGPCSYGVTNGYGVNERFYGRGYSTKNGKNNVVKDILSGENFKEQWEYANASDPEIVFVTGFNEWIAQKSSEGYGWIDTFNTEWSRDIEMTKARTYSSDDVDDYSLQGYGDNYYMQLVKYVREYKGIYGNYIKPQSATIEIGGDLRAWDEISSTSNVFYNIACKNIGRDHIGASSDLHYVEPAALNFVREIKVTNDDRNLYFYIKTDGPINNEDAKSLNLLISLPDKKNQNTWEGYHFVVNRKVLSNAYLSLESFESKDYELRYAINGQVMEIEIPLKFLGLKKDKVNIDFKVCDSIKEADNILDYYVSGSSVPLGRMNFIYRNSVEKKAGIKMSKLEIIVAILGSLILLAAAAFFLNRTIKRKKG